jgi:hypothetical protein
MVHAAVITDISFFITVDTLFTSWWYFHIYFTVTAAHIKSSSRSWILFLPSLFSHLRLPSQETPSILSQSPKSYFTTGGLPPISSWRQDPWGPRPEIFFQLNSYGNSLCITSPTRRWGLSLMNTLGLSSSVYFAHITRDERIMLKLVVEKSLWVVWSGVIWLRIGTSGGLLWSL